ncbi:MAG: hypothetical protein ACRDXX_10875, partial [Stackebrandtia sp.]
PADTVAAMRHLTADTATPRRPEISDAPVAALVPAAVREVLSVAETWLGWNDAPVYADGNVWTPHKALRRATDHLVDHLAEIECRLNDVPTVPDGWHGRKLTLDSDWARFTEADLDEATSRLTRLAAWYEARLSTLDSARLDHRPDADTWTIREVVCHVAGITYYADQLGRLA